MMLKGYLASRKEPENLINIFDSTNKVAEDLKQLPEFQAVQEAVGQLKGNEEDLKLYREVMQFQASLQNKQMSGQEVTAEDDAKFKEYSEQMNGNQNIANLMEKEQMMFQLLQQIQQAMTRPLDQLYSELNN